MKTEQMIGSFFRDILDRLDENGKADLQSIIRQKNPKLVENFIEEHNVSHFLRDAEGNTMLHLFCGSLFPKNIKPLIQEGLDVNSTNYNGDSPLHLASSTFCISNIEILIENGADLTKKNKRGETCLHIAARYGRKDVINYLLSQGVDADIENYKGQTAFDISLETEQYEVSALLTSAA